MTRRPEDDCAERVIRETAARFGVMVPAQFSLPPAPIRLGHVLDDFRSGGPARHLNVGPEIILCDLKFFPAEGLIEKRDGTIVTLTEKERDIILSLLGAPGKRLGRQELLQRVWGYADGIETHTLETHIYRLRQKLEGNPAKPTLLMTDGDGYRLYAGGDFS